MSRVSPRVWGSRHAILFVRIRPNSIRFDPDEVPLISTLFSVFIASIEFRWNLLDTCVIRIIQRNNGKYFILNSFAPFFVYKRHVLKKIVKIIQLMDNRIDMERCRVLNLKKKKRKKKFYNGRKKSILFFSSRSK